MYGVLSEFFSWINSSMYRVTGGFVVAVALLCFLFVLFGFVPEYPLLLKITKENGLAPSSGLHFIFRECLSWGLTGWTEHISSTQRASVSIHDFRAPQAGTPSWKYHKPMWSPPAMWKNTSNNLPKYFQWTYDFDPDGKIGCFGHKSAVERGQVEVCYHCDCFFNTLSVQPFPKEIKILEIL